MCLSVEDRLFTGDTLLIGATGRTDLPSGNAEALHDSLFNGILQLDPALKVFPAHEYKGRSHSTVGDGNRQEPATAEARSRCEFVEMMHALNLTHAHAYHRSVAHQHERRQDRRSNAG